MTTELLASRRPPADTGSHNHYTRRPMRLTPRPLTVLLNVLCLCGLLPIARADGDVAAPPEFAGVRDFIEGAVDQQRAPSVAVGVVRDGTLVWAEGFGDADLATRRPATSNSIYRLASISKPLTASGLMMLVEQDRIDLDAPANRYLPGEKLRCYAGSADEMTVRRLANHTAGMPLHYSFFFEGTAPPSMDETIRRYGFAAARPGARWEYSNLAYGVLNYMTETVAGTPWREYMETRLYDPLGMTRTSDRIRPGFESDAAVQYNRLPVVGFQAVGHYDFDHPGASAVCSSVNDLARFARMHLAGGTLDGVRVLSEDSVRRMQVVTGRNGPGDDGCGIAWFVSRVRGRRCVAHGGGMPGVSTALRLFPDDGAATIVLTNGTDRSLTSGVSERLAAVLFPDAGDERDGDSVEAPRPPARGRGPGSVEAAPERNPAVQSEPNDAELDGVWQGRIVRADGDVAVTLKITASREGAITIGGQPERSLGNARFSADGLTGWFAADFSARAEEPGPLQIELRLNREGASLTGVAIAHGAGRFALSHWIELARGEQDTAPRVPPRGFEPRSQD